MLPEYDQLFHFKRCEFSSKEMDDIGIQAQSLASLLKKPGLEMPLQNLITELFRYSFRQHFLNIQSDFIDKPIEEGKAKVYDLVSAEAFTKICEEKKLPVELIISKNDHEVIIEIRHYGIMGNNEIRSIRQVFASIEKSLHESKQHQIYSREQLAEKFSSGIPLALISLHGIGIAQENFQVATLGKFTHMRVVMPLKLFQESDVPLRTKLNNEDEDQILRNLFSTLQYTVIEFDFAGNIVLVDGDIFKIMGLNHSNAKALLSILPPRFFEDIIWGPFSVKSMDSFENYRLMLSSSDNKTTVLFNVSGVKYKTDKIATLWQAVNISQTGNKFSEGAIFENINIMKIVRPYIPQMILDKARDCVRKGLHVLPIERKEVTILFADLIGFTQKSEKLPHDDVIELLNLTMSTIVQSIERYSGYVDKFIGDGIMCIFMNPLDAIISAIEIQNNLLNLNEFRKIGGQDALELRIGINTGKVILGSVGIKTRMDWTALGDVVNTASRIEKVSRKYSVLVGDDTYQKVKSSVEYLEKTAAHFKGKEKDYALYFIKSATFVHESKLQTISLNNEDSPEEL